MKVSKDITGDTDKRLVERERNQGRARGEEILQALGGLPDLSGAIAPPDTDDDTGLAQELQREKQQRDARIVRLLERARAPKPLAAPPPEPFEE